MVIKCIISNHVRNSTLAIIRFKDEYFIRLYIIVRVFGQAGLQYEPGSAAAKNDYVECIRM